MINSSRPRALRHDPECGATYPHTDTGLRTPGYLNSRNLLGIGRAISTAASELAIRYEKPASDLSEYITDYHFYSTSRSPSEQIDWFLPSGANVRIVLDGASFSVDIGGHLYGSVPEISLFGPTSHTLKTTHHGGVVVGFGISPLGWSRLFNGSAGDYHNRIVPLSAEVPEAFVDALRAALVTLPRGQALAGVLDDLLRRQLRPPHAEELQIRRLTALIVGGQSSDIVAVADELGISTHTLRRLSTRHFGLPPKLLLRRARFMRAFLRIVQSDQSVDYALVGEGYFDVPHFLRDANAFLGMTPRRFLAHNTPFLDAAFRARLAVLGSSTHVLQDAAAASSSRRLYRTGPIARRRLA